MPGTDRVTELLDGRRLPAGWHRDRTTGPGHRKHNALVGRLNRVAEEAVAAATAATSGSGSVTATCAAPGSAAPGRSGSPAEVGAAALPWAA
jgi:hypothetical protein